MGRAKLPNAPKSLEGLRVYDRAFQFIQVDGFMNGVSIGLGGKQEFRGDAPRLFLDEVVG